MSKLQIVQVDETKLLPWDEEIYSDEVNYNGGISSTMVGTVNHKNKTVRPTHGYFKPNKTGVLVEKYAKTIGYTFKG